MQNNGNESHSVVTDVNSLNSALATLGYSDSVYRLNHNHAMSGFPQHLSFVEAVNNLVCAQMANRDETLNSNIQDPNQVMEGIPLTTVTPVTNLSSARNGTLDYQEKLLNFGHCVYPFDDSSGVVCSSVETMMNHGYESLPFDSSTKWDLNKFVTDESFGRVIGRNGVQPLNPTENSFANVWILSQNTAGTNSNSRGTSRFSNELSLSLASSQPSTVHGTSIQDQCSEQTSCSSNNLSLSFDSYKPLQPSSLSGSRLFQAMQEILAEIACYALVSYSTDGIDNGNKVPGLSSHCFFPSDKLEIEAKKKQMLALLQMIDEQYNRCLDEVHTVVSAFHALTELDPNLHARFALPTISSMYKNLRERISNHILAMGTNLDEGGERQKEEKSFETSFIQEQWALQQLRKSDSQLWRPQRGLPERSVSVLRAWMFQNFLHPYPRDAEKHLLAIKSGLTRNQVSNWFINARVRLWKPMIEEMYAEMSRRKARRNGEEDQTDHVNFHRNPMHFENRRFAMD